MSRQVDGSYMVASIVTMSLQNFDDYLKNNVKQCFEKYSEYITYIVLYGIII
jgi:hypothetical protein